MPQRPATRGAVAKSPVPAPRVLRVGVRRQVPHYPPAGVSRPGLGRPSHGPLHVTPLSLARASPGAVRSWRAQGGPAMRHALLLIVLSSLAFAPAPKPRPDPSARDLKEMQGEWAHRLTSSGFARTGGSS